MILAILAFWFGYKKARDTGRSPWLWSLITGGSFIGTQIVLSVLIVAFLVIGAQIWDWSPTAYENYITLISFVAAVPSFVVLWLIFRYLDKIPEPESNNAPPPPPDFGSQL